ncbi:MAG: manganese efflux pump MntP family protein [Usitatibacter sp.]
MDAVAVSVAAGISRGRATWGEAFAMGATFGVFQAIMPALGYAGGALFRDAIEAYDHWIVFVLLAIVGGHMILESLSKDEDKPQGNPFAFRRLMLLGFATSVDALAVGLTLSLIDVPLLWAVALIGGVTFALCVPAVHMGARLGTRLAHRAELVGGLVLIGIGVKILVEHLAEAS